jgi:hypothetical protein
MELQPRGLCVALHRGADVRTHIAEIHVRHPAAMRARHGMGGDNAVAQGGDAGRMRAGCRTAACIALGSAVRSLGNAFAA